MLVINLFFLADRQYIYFHLFGEELAVNIKGVM